MPTDVTTIEGTIDVDGIYNFAPTMPLASGRRALANRLGRRLITRRGAFPWRPNDGTDLRQFLLGKSSPSDIAAAAKAECMKDEQVETVRVELEALNLGRDMTLTLLVTDADGPFELTMLITAAAATVVALQGAA